MAWSNTNCFYTCLFEKNQNEKFVLTNISVCHHTFKKSFMQRKLKQSCVKL